MTVPKSSAILIPGPPMKKHLLLCCSILICTFTILSNSAFADNQLLRTYMEQSIANQETGIANIDSINRLYIENHYQPLWSEAGVFAPQLPTLLTEIEESAKHGFQLSRYHYTEVTDTTLPREIRDVLLTDALFSQIQHRTSGIVNRKTIDNDQANWFIEPQNQTPETLVRTLLAQPEMMGTTLQNLWPEHPDYWALIKKRSELVAQQPNERPPLVFEKLLKPGSDSDDIRILKNRLWGEGDHSTRFDQQLEAEIRALQRHAGLEPDGVIGPATLAVLNVSPRAQIAQIDANLERWRWLPRDIPGAHIRVNIASFRLRVFEQQTQILEMDVIVGRPYRQTPVFTERLKYLVLNPYWNVPPSIARKDKLPLLRSDAISLSSLGYEARTNETPDFVSVDKLDWTQIKPGQFVLRQRPGNHNALGKIKFMLPNVHDVYLHDTPDKVLFSKTERLFSSGCIRLSDPELLARWLLEREQNPASTRLGELFSANETTTLYLTKPIPVYMVYLTVFIGDDGEVVFRRDIYGRDQAIIDALNNTTPLQQHMTSP